MNYNQIIYISNIFIMYANIISIILIIMFIGTFFYINKTSNYVTTNDVPFKIDHIKCTTFGTIDRDTFLACPATCHNTKTKLESMMELCSFQYKKNKSCKAIAGVFDGNIIKYSPCRTFTIDYKGKIKGGYIVS